MGSTSVKSDIKTLFLILNTLCGVTCGFYMVSDGIAIAIFTRILDAPPAIGMVVGGLILLGITALGYCGAIKDSKVMLIVYAAVMALLSILDIVGFALLSSNGVFMAVMLCTHAGITVFAVALAAVLANQAGRQASQGCVLSPPQPAP